MTGNIFSGVDVVISIVGKTGLEAIGLRLLAAIRWTVYYKGLSFVAQSCPSATVPYTVFRL